MSSAARQVEQESDRLRQIARAVMAGDISLEDYRQIRSTMIDTFAGEDEQEGEHEPAVRRGEGLDVDELMEAESPWTLLGIVLAGSALLAGVILLYFYLV